MIFIQKHTVVYRFRLSDLKKFSIGQVERPSLPLFTLIIIAVNIIITMEDDSKENHIDTAPTGKVGFANASLAKMLNPNSGKYNLCHVVDEDKGIVQLLVKVKNRNRRVASRFGDYKTYPVKINLYFNQEHGMGVTPPKLSGGRYVPADFYQDRQGFISDKLFNFSQDYQQNGFEMNDYISLNTAASHFQTQLMTVQYGDINQFLQQREFSTMYGDDTNQFTYKLHGHVSLSVPKLFYGDEIIVGGVDLKGCNPHHKIFRQKEGKYDIIGKIPVPLIAPGACVLPVDCETIRYQRNSDSSELLINMMKEDKYTHIMFVVAGEKPDLWNYLAHFDSERPPIKERTYGANNRFSKSDNILMCLMRSDKNGNPKMFIGMSTISLTVGGLVRPKVKIESTGFGNCKNIEVTYENTFAFETIPLNKILYSFAKIGMCSGSFSNKRCIGYQLQPYHLGKSNYCVRCGSLLRPFKQFVPTQFC